MSSSVLAGLAFVAVVASFFYLRAKTQEIHVLVNRRLELELQEIRDLKTAAAQQESGSAPVTPSDAGRADDG